MTVKIPPKFRAFREMVLDKTNEALFVGYLAEYSAGGRYTGAYFNEVTTTTGWHPDCIEISDVVALSLLSVTLKPEAANYFLADSEDRKDLSRALSAQPDRDLASLTVEEAVALEAGNLNEAWRLIKKADGVGQTRTSKLLARKRPRLIPIWDSVISDVLGLPGTKDMWKIFHAALTEDMNYLGGSTNLDERLGELADRAGVSDRYSRLRVLDILAWMYGKKKGKPSEVYTELMDEPKD
ncbi:DUF6308 family protein [Brachybacterium muris]|uniref:DUF6308 family protein n=1 Tax=Brachybacterium muris TaxID=219301 RepID=UPI00223C1313|nr:DUF6308 family protein [Brachybacterium muris]MCT1653832.1 DUF6308 family protein [Brachybacterium muris]